MSAGPFHLVICPGAWSPPCQWDGFVDAMTRAPIDLSGVTAASWPETDAGLAAHVEAVLRAVPDQGQPVVLLGHSFGAFPMLEAGAKLGARLRGAVFVDGFLPDHGLSAFAQSAQSQGPSVMRAAARDGMVPPPDPAIWGLTGDLADELKRQMRPHSLASLEEGLSAAARDVIHALPHKAFIGASTHRGAGNPFKRAFDGLEGREDWFSVQINGGHMLHVERPSALAYWCSQFLRMVAGKGF
ncbi:MAG: alpha/beta hydrolase [Alphaproteobacteria bacterium]